MKDFAKSVRTNNEIRGPHSMITADGRINYSGSDMAEITMLEKELKGLIDMSKKDKANDYSYQIRELQKEISEKKKKRAFGNESIYKQEASLFQGLKKDAEKEIEKLGKEMSELGNSKTGNTAHSDKVEVIKKLIAGGWSVEDIYKMLKTEGYEVEKSFIERLKTGNETKGERKFGKVMVEFEEGALKTPQGKTVTDPAQAKAIAYSEADKVDNLKRARNAMNKKCGNAQITLWKGNDTVLISEDGTVQYLESNSFEVDRDKYDSQQKAIEEMTKEGYRKK